MNLSALTRELKQQKCILLTGLSLPKIQSGSELFTRSANAKLRALRRLGSTAFPLVRSEMFRPKSKRQSQLSSEERNSIRALRHQNHSAPPNGAGGVIPPRSINMSPLTGEIRQLLRPPQFTIPLPCGWSVDSTRRSSGRGRRAVTFPSTTSLFDIGLPYMSLFASSSGRNVAPQARSRRTVRARAST